MSKKPVGTNIMRYSMLIALLSQLLGKGLIDDKEYNRIKGKLMRDYGVISDLTI